MIRAALAAAEQIFSPPFRSVFWKSLGLTVLLLALLGIVAEKLVVATIALPHAVWLATLLHVAAGLGLVVGLAFLVTADLVRRRRPFLRRARRPRRGADRWARRARTRDADRTPPCGSGSSSARSACS